MKKQLLFTSAFLWVCMPIIVFAHGTGYLEFNPDKSSSLKVANVNTPSQLFFAQNDFIGAVDFWISNPGATGTATFALLNEQGSVLTSRTVTVPTITNTSTGTRFHVDFNSQFSVLADDRYSIRVTSSMPELRLYNSDRVQLVAYNSPFVSEYITGVGRLGSEEQLFSFKYALLETNEVSAPIISNVGWTVVSSNDMQVEFNANEPVDYKIEYGPTGQGYTASTNFLGDYQFCASGIATCKLNIQVSPNTTYNYALTAKDYWGNQSQFIGTFTSGQSQTPTPTPTPSSAPIITNLRIADVTHNSVSVAWTTNEIANSNLLIVFGDFISVADAFDPTLELEHYLEIENELGVSTPYTAEISSFDIDNNESKASISFTTLGANPSPSPSPSSSPTPTASLPPNSPLPTTSGSPTPTGEPVPTITPSPANTALPAGSDASGSGATVQWVPPNNGEPTDGYRVDVFDNDGNLITTIYVPSGSSSAEIPGLTEGEYSVIVYANNEGVFKKVTQPIKLNTKEPTFITRLISLWPYFLPALGLIGVLIWLRKRQASQKTPQVLS